MRPTRLRRGIVLAAAGGAAFVLVVAAFAAAGGATRGLAVGQAGAGRSVCGLGNGKKATGTPIKLGGMFTQVPGIDFTPVGTIANAYFKCVNDNGGINGRPISYRIYTEQLKADGDAAIARKLVESDKVVGIAGNTSLIDCVVNHKYYEQKGYFLIIAGVPGECFGTPNIAPVNMGPRYSDIGAAQALIRHGAKTIVMSSGDTSIAAYANGGALLVAKKAGIKAIDDREPFPIQDPNADILKMYQEAGPGGGIVLNYTPETALPLMKAAEAQGIADKVLWGSSTPIANEYTASNVDPELWNSKNLFINSEFALLTSTGPDMTLYRAITKKYAPRIAIQSFGQMGFMVGKFVTAALLSIRGPVTKQSYNEAVQDLKNQKTDMLCKPWYFGRGLKAHIPNNWDITVSYDHGKVVQTEPCFQIAAVDPGLAAARAAEKKFKLNTG
jgi:branched-chain amino acid transport system substrate-binding protein